MPEPEQDMLDEAIPSLTTFYVLEAAQAAARGLWLEPADRELMAMAADAFGRINIDYARLVRDTATSRKCSVSHARAVVADRVRAASEQMWQDIGAPDLDGQAGIAGDVRAALQANVCPDALPEWMA